MQGSRPGKQESQRDFGIADGFYGNDFRKTAESTKTAWASSLNGCAEEEHLVLVDLLLPPSAALDATDVVIEDMVRNSGDAGL